jgi:hypothetical protein
MRNLFDETHGKIYIDRPGIDGPIKHYKLKLIYGECDVI